MSANRQKKEPQSGLSPFPAFMKRTRTWTMSPRADTLRHNLDRYPACPPCFRLLMRSEKHVQPTAFYFAARIQNRNKLSAVISRDAHLVPKCEYSWIGCGESAAMGLDTCATCRNSLRIWATAYFTGAVGGDEHPHDSRGDMLPRRCRLRKHDARRRLRPGGPLGDCLPQRDAKQRGDQNFCCRASHGCSSLRRSRNRFMLAPRILPTGTAKARFKPSGPKIGAFLCLRQGRS